METDIVSLRVSLPSCMRLLYRGMLADLIKQVEHAPALKGELVMVEEGADKHLPLFKSA